MSTTPAHYTVIVTGSRTPDDTVRRLVHRDLDALLTVQLAHGRALVVRHGACRTGADFYTAEWCRLHRDHVIEEPRPADWGGPCRSDCRHGPRLPSADGHTRCPAAGPRRSRWMVDAGADELLAYPLGESRGTRRCVQYALAAGIPVRVPPELRERAS